MSASTSPSFVPPLGDFLRRRLADAPSGSYSFQVMSDPVLTRRKIMEEAFEVCLELESQPVDADRLAEEVADLVFHVLCGLTGAGVDWSRVEAVLTARHGEPS